MFTSSCADFVGENLSSPALLSVWSAHLDEAGYGELAELVDNVLRVQAARVGYRGSVRTAQAVMTAGAGLSSQAWQTILSFCNGNTEMAARIIDPATQESRTFALKMASDPAWQKNWWKAVQKAGSSSEGVIAELSQRFNSLSRFTKLYQPSAPGLMQNGRVLKMVDQGAKLAPETLEALEKLRAGEAAAMQKFAPKIAAACRTALSENMAKVLPLIERYGLKGGASMVTRLLGSRVVALLGPIGAAVTTAQIAWEVGQLLNQIPAVQKAQAALGNSLGGAIANQQTGGWSNAEANPANQAAAAKAIQSAETAMTAGTDVRAARKQVWQSLANNPQVQYLFLTQFNTKHRAEILESTGQTPSTAAAPANQAVQTGQSVQTGQAAQSPQTAKRAPQNFPAAVQYLTRLTQDMIYRRQTPRQTALVQVRQSLMNRFDQATINSLMQSVEQGLGPATV